MRENNLLLSLFRYRPREGRISREDFLTESLAYVLRADEDALNSFLDILETPDNQKRSTPLIDTQVHEQSSTDSRSLYYDMLVRPDGADEFVICCEHKWGTRLDEEQLRKYRKQLSQKSRDVWVVFITDNHEDRDRAEQSGVADKSLTWDIVLHALDTAGPGSQITTRKQLIQFMEQEGLMKFKTLTLGAMQGFVSGQGVPGQLKAICNALTGGLASDVPGAVFRKGLPRTVDNYGRIGLQYDALGESSLKLTIGFLYDPSDHLPGGALLAQMRGGGVDLMIRLEANPHNHPRASIQGTLTAVAKVKDQIERDKNRNDVLTTYGVSGNAVNPWNLLLVRECFADVLKTANKDLLAETASAQEQFDATREALRDYLKALFKDSRLTEALKHEFFIPE